MARALQIGQVARETGLTADAIRFHEKQRLLRRPPRTEGGFRLSCRYYADGLPSKETIRAALREAQRQGG